jgi:hypothetical protein
VTFRRFLLIKSTQVRNRGMDPEDPYSQLTSRHDVIIAEQLPWDPETEVNGKNLGAYPYPHGHFIWGKYRNL